MRVFEGVKSTDLFIDAVSMNGSIEERSARFVSEMMNSGAHVTMIQSGSWSVVGPVVGSDHGSSSSQYQHMSHHNTVSMITVSSCQSHHNIFRVMEPKILWHTRTCSIVCNGIIICDMWHWDNRLEWKVSTTPELTLWRQELMRMKVE